MVRGAAVCEGIDIRAVNDDWEQVRGIRSLEMMFSGMRASPCFINMRSGFNRRVKYSPQ